MSGNDCVAPGTTIARLSMNGVTGSPVTDAECRVWSSALSFPSRIQSVRPSGSPLSKTELNRLDVAAVTSGVDSRPDIIGSL